MDIKNLNDLECLHFVGDKVNLLFYTPLGETELHAQFYLNNTSEEVVHEEIVREFYTALSCIEVFRSQEYQNSFFQFESISLSL